MNGWPGLTVTAHIGGGRHGQVYRARRGAGDPSDVAVKVFSVSETARRERMALERFDHAHVVRLVEPLGTSLVLEYLEGGTIEDRLTQGRPFSFGEVAAMVDDVGAALDHLHGAGWVHGDLNPSNIGLRSGGTAVLLDFATAGRADHRPLRESTPEFVGKRPRRAPSVDVRALARTAARCLDPDDPDVVGPAADLEEIVARLDEGEDAGTDGVRRVFGSCRRTPIAPATSTRPGRGSTQSFGPRPTAAPDGVASRRRSGRVGRLAPASIALVALTLALGWQLAGPGAAPPPQQRTEEAGKVVSADETLRAHDAIWDPITGVLEHEAMATRMRVGARGDLAAIGDWDCDGDATLGVYRPTTGEWFTFASWRANSRSSDPVLLDTGTRLAVGHDQQGCAYPAPLPRQ